jgi:hypothetical protein
VQEPPAKVARSKESRTASDLPEQITRFEGDEREEKKRPKR